MEKFNKESRSQKLESHPDLPKLLSHRDAENTEPYHTTPKDILLLLNPNPQIPDTKNFHQPHRIRIITNHTNKWIILF